MPTNLCVPGGHRIRCGAYRIGWDLAKGRLFPVVLLKGVRGDTALSEPRMVTALQGHLRVAGLSSHFTHHSLRSGGF